MLSQLEEEVPWSEWVALVEPPYPNGEQGGPPVGVERRLRVSFLQPRFDLPDPAVEDALYESPTMRSLVGIDPGGEPAPDETTVCRFRHLLERHGLGPQMLTPGNGYLQRQGLQPGTGAIVAATLLAAPSSTRNKSGQRDPEMHPVRKGKPWCFGRKAHGGVAAATRLIHSVAATAANVADRRVLPELLHGEETEVWGDQASPVQAEAIQQRAPKAKVCTHRRWRSRLHVYPEVREQNRIQSKTRSRVQHGLAVMMPRFGFTKVRYRGLARNLNRLLSTCALINLVTASKLLLAVPEQSCA